MFTWNSYCILYFLPPLTKGGAGIRGIITPVYRTCVYSNNHFFYRTCVYSNNHFFTELVCTVTTIFYRTCVYSNNQFLQNLCVQLLLLCKTEIPLFCTVYSKNALLMCIYITTYTSLPIKHSFLLLIR